MKTLLTSLLAIALFVISANAQTKKNGTPDMRYKSNRQTSSNSYTPSYSPKTYTPTSTHTPSTSTYTPSTTTTTRTIYPGQTHTDSHGGSFPGSTNSHHKDGHYVSPTFTPNYGIHKTKKH